MSNKFGKTNENRQKTPETPLSREGGDVFVNSVRVISYKAADILKQTVQNLYPQETQPVAQPAPRIQEVVAASALSATQPWSTAEFPAGLVAGAQQQVGASRIEKQQDWATDELSAELAEDARQQIVNSYPVKQDA